MSHALNPKTIVVFRTLQLGDMLCTVPIFRALRKRFPHTTISLIGLPWAKEFVTRYSMYIDEFIEFPGWPGLPERTADVKKILTFLQKIQRRNFDLAIQLQGSGEISNQIVSLFHAKYSAGFYTPNNYRPNNSFFTPTVQDHETKKFFHVLKTFGIEDRNYELEFPITQNDYRKYEKLYQQYALEKPFICIHPGARDPKRRWSTKKFAYIADKLAEEGYRIILTGTSAEESLCKAVYTNMKHHAVDLSGATALGSLAALMKNSALFISNDTGVSHLAAAIKAQSIIIYSQQSKQKYWMPFDTNLHTSLPFPETKNKEYVLSAILQKLGEKQNNITTEMHYSSFSLSQTHI